MDAYKSRSRSRLGQWLSYASWFRFLAATSEGPKDSLLLPTYRGFALAGDSWVESRDPIGGSPTTASMHLVVSWPTLGNGIRVAIEQDPWIADFMAAMNSQPGPAEYVKDHLVFKT